MIAQDVADSRAGTGCSGEAHGCRLHQPQAGQGIWHRPQQRICFLGLGGRPLLGLLRRGHCTPQSAVRLQHHGEVLGRYVNVSQLPLCLPPMPNVSHLMYAGSKNIVAQDDVLLLKRKYRLKTWRAAVRGGWLLQVLMMWMSTSAPLLLRTTFRCCWV